MKHEAKGIFAELGRVLKSIEDDLVLPLDAHANLNRGGALGISRQVFCYFDYLGALAYSSNPGRSTVKDAVLFMESYLVKANDSYNGKCELMYHMWRHGTVHEYDPKNLTCKDRSFELRWMANNGPEAHNRACHLKCFCANDKANCYHWNINIFELVDDLRSSILHFMTDIEADSTALAKAKKNYERLSKAEVLDGSSRQTILEQANTVINDVAGVVDERGSVIKKFESAQKRRDFLDSWKIVV